jgi:DNA repair and recombination protein RAD54B
MISFVCPDLLGPLGTFKRVFADPVARANERDVSPEEAAVGLERSTELARRVEPFVLRRTAEVNAAYLPPLTSYVVFCRLSNLQVDPIYAIAVHC